MGNDGALPSKKIFVLRPLASPERPDYPKSCREHPGSDEMRRTRSGQDDATFNMSWIYLILAGLCETCWAISLKYCDGIKRPVPLLFVGLGLAGSMFMFSLAIRSVPIGTAYAVWVGVGAFGAAITGAVLFHEPVSPARVFCLVLLVTAIIGLKLTSGANVGS